MGGEIIQKESSQIGFVDLGKKADLGDIKKGVATALEIAKNTSCKKVTFPLLGTGIVGLPTIDVARTMKEAAGTVLKIQSVLVIRSKKDYDSFKDLF